MGEVIAKATFDSSYPSGDANFTSTNFRNQFQGLYGMDFLPLRPIAHSVPNMSIMVLGSDASDFANPVYYGNNNQRISLSSGDSPTMSAPSGNPKYDLIYADPSGDVFVTAGAEAASPTIPNTPSGDVIPICAIYHRVGTSKIVNYADKDSYTGDSYIAKDLRPWLTVPRSSDSFKVKVDVAATEDYLGATATAGALRVDNTSIQKTDGGDYITLAVKADGINDTHIDWGTGANQVSLDDVPDGTSYERVAAAELASGIYKDATTAVKGIASFSDTNFSVASGVVTVKTDGIGDTEINWGTGAGQVSSDDVTEGSTNKYLVAGSVSQTMLKATSGEVLLGDTATGTDNVDIQIAEYDSVTDMPSSYTTIISCLLAEPDLRNETLPGGAYGFYPQIKYSGSYNIYAQQTYITASGHDHWIFLLIAKKDIYVGDKLRHKKGKICAAYQAPDHPCANQIGAIVSDISHPFGKYDFTNYDIVIVDNDMLNIATQKINRRRGLLEIIVSDFIVDDSKSAEYKTREIIKINEFPNDPVGEVIAEFRTPEWARILIPSEIITKEKLIVDKLNPEFLYRKMRLK